jgi:lipopolysaccharide transport system ATP-binding protein
MSHEQAVVLKIREIGKAYRRYDSEWQRVLSWFGLPGRAHEEVWPLRDISLTVKPGESLGIVGPNGAGKSTLLKIIAGTLKPSTGTLMCTGRVSAILELGMGFHPDLTGRQNAIHALGLLGHVPADISTSIEAIAEFAEIGDYFDQPVRTYSSGMQMRVAFAVATSQRPDLLIVDEAFSVGDAYFQHKSMARIRGFLEKGTALILVSHDMQAIMTLCDRAILMEQGQIVADGLPENVVNVYAALTSVKEQRQELLPMAANDNSRVIRSGLGGATIIEHRLTDMNGCVLDNVEVSSQIRIEVLAKTDRAFKAIGLGIMLRDRYGIPVFGTNSYLQSAPAKEVQAHECLRFVVEITAELGPGNYSLTLALEDEDDRRLDWIDHAAVFDVFTPGKPLFIGAARLPVKCFSATREAATLHTSE